MGAGSVSSPNLSFIVSSWSSKRKWREGWWSGLMWVPLARGLNRLIWSGLRGLTWVFIDWEPGTRDEGEDLGLNSGNTALRRQGTWDSARGCDCWRAAGLVASSAVLHAAHGPRGRTHANQLGLATMHHASFLLQSVSSTHTHPPEGGGLGMGDGSSWVKVVGEGEGEDEVCTMETGDRRPWHHHRRRHHHSRRHYWVSWNLCLAVLVHLVSCLPLLLLSH